MRKIIEMLKKIWKYIKDNPTVLVFILGIIYEYWKN